MTPQRTVAAIVCLGAVYATAVLSFEIYRPHGLTYDGLWTTRLGITTSLFLAANFVAVWWYAKLTQTIASTAQQQYRLGLEESKAAAAERIQANKPIVVTVREEDGAGGYHYFLHNVGRGTAINLWYVDTSSPDAPWRPRSLGALGPGGRRLLNRDLEKPLCDGGGICKHLLIAEGIPTRTTRWTVTINARTTQAGGDMRHDLAVLASAGQSSVADLLVAEDAKLREQVASMKVAAA
jgi:hypothetical protein